MKKFFIQPFLAILFTLTAAALAFGADISKESRTHVFDDRVYKMEFAYIPTTGGSITAAADAGGGLVKLTDAGHGLAAGDHITISGTSSYNGNEEVVAVIDANNFTITATFVADETGTWVYLAGNQGKLQYQGRALPSSKKSQVKWQIKRNIYDSNGNISRSTFPRSGGAETNDFRFEWDERTNYLYSTAE